MTIKQFIEKAIEGGWKQPDLSQTDNYDGVPHCRGFLLDPKAWQAVGKVERWGKEPAKGGICKHCKVKTHIQPSFDSGCNHVHYPEACEVCNKNTADYKKQMHNMVDALAEGKTIEEFLKTL